MMFLDLVFETVATVLFAHKVSPSFLCRTSSHPILSPHHRHGLLRQGPDQLLSHCCDRPPQCVEVRNLHRQNHQMIPPVPLPPTFLRVTLQIFEQSLYR